MNGTYLDGKFVSFEDVVLGFVMVVDCWFDLGGYSVSSVEVDVLMIAVDFHKVCGICGRGFVCLWTGVIFWYVLWYHVVRMGVVVFIRRCTVVVNVLNDKWVVE